MSTEASADPLGLPIFRMLGLTKLVSEAIATAQSTEFACVALSGMNRDRVATSSVAVLPPSSSPGWKIGEPSASCPSSART
jgi:hypothetical protein